MTRRLTPQQIRIRDLRRIGRTTADIAVLLGIAIASVRAVEGYRPRRGKPGRPPKVPVTT